MRIVKSSQFVEDEIECLEYSSMMHGEDGALRYARLIDRALKEISKDPLRVGVRKSVRCAYCYHLRHSKTRSGVDGVTVKNPVHFIVFRIDQRTESLEALRILYEGMLPENHL